MDTYPIREYLEGPNAYEGSFRTISGKPLDPESRFWALIKCRVIVTNERGERWQNFWVGS